MSGVCYIATLKSKHKSAQVFTPFTNPVVYPITSSMDIYYSKQCNMVVTVGKINAVEK